MPRLGRLACFGMLTGGELFLCLCLTPSPAHLNRSPFLPRSTSAAAQAVCVRRPNAGQAALGAAGGVRAALGGVALLGRPSPASNHQRGEGKAVLADGPHSARSAVPVSGAVAGHGVREALCVGAWGCFRTVMLLRLLTPAVLDVLCLQPAASVIANQAAPCIVPFGIFLICVSPTNPCLLTQGGGVRPRGQLG